SFEEEQEPDELELDINIPAYFEESFQTCENFDNSLCSNVKPVTLQKEDTFSSFEEAESVVYQFSEYNGFKKYEDLHWFIKAIWEEESNALINLFWMSPEQIFLWCEFGEAIGHNNTSEQMKESVYYVTVCSTIDDIKLINDSKPLINKDINDEPDSIILYARYLITTYLDQNEIEKDRFEWLHPFSNNEIDNSGDEKFTKNLFFYRKIWGLTRAAIDKCMLYHDEEFIHLIEDYLNKIHAKENKLISAQEIQHQTVIENGIEDKENIDLLFMNPHKAVVKRRP
ncbi:12384_t:CDS:2, partial [Racocetra persica]